MFEKTKINEKEARVGPFFKTHGLIHTRRNGLLIGLFISLRKPVSSDYLFNWLITTMKICPIANIFAKQIQNMSKIGSTFFQFLDKPSKNCQRL